MANKLPDFIMVGAPKCGTTTMHEILMQHTQIFLPSEKEIHYFDNDSNFSKGLSWYQSYFKNASPNICAGDITPSYMYYDYAIERILAQFGKNIKIVFMLRNPVDRAFSEFSYNISRGLINEYDFLKAIKLEDDNMHLPPFSRRYFSFISRGYYSLYIKNFLKYFPKENLHFILFEDEFIKTPQACLRDLQEFLGIEYQELNTNLRSNTGFVPHYPKINKLLYDPNPVRSFLKKMIPIYTVRKDLKNLIKELNSNKYKSQQKLSLENRQEIYETYYAEDISLTEELIQKDLSSWIYKRELV